jgi:ankyrin repeat protein
MRVLFRIFIVLVSGLILLVLVLPLVFGDKRPQAYRAAVYGDTNYLKEYLARGSNVNALLISYHAGHRRAPLLLGAVGNGQAETVDFLLKNGANPNLGGGGHTPLTEAVGLDHTEAKIRILELLLKAGADPNLGEPTSYKWTPLIWTAELGDTEVVRMLVRAGAGVNGTNSDGATPLHFAANAEIVQLLIAAGADVNKRSLTRSTPLHHARTAEVARLLITAGANRNATFAWVHGYPLATNQASPADVALEERRFEVLAVLTNSPVGREERP